MPTLADLARAGALNVSAAPLPMPQAGPAVTLAMLARAGLLGGQETAAPSPEGAPDPSALAEFLRTQGIQSGPQAGVGDLGNAPPPSPPPTLPGPYSASVPPPTNALMPQTQEEQASQDQSNRVANMAFEMSGIGPARRSGQAFSQGDILGGLGNAGMAMLPYRPLAGLGTMGLTLGGALGADIGGGLGEMLRTSPANAQQQRQPPSEQPMSREEFFRTNRTQRGTLTDAVAAAERTVRESQAYRELVESRQLTRAQAMVDRAARTARETFERANSDANVASEEERLGRQYETYLTSFNAQRDRGRAFARAEEARDRELARDRRFADTYTGRAFDLFGGYAPGVAGGITGLLTRTARGATAWGAAAGLGSAHVPLGYESLFSPVDNPRRRALEEYAAALPENEPERARAIRDLQDLNRYPTANPVRREATDQLYDLGGLLKRSGLGLAEGALGGHLGRALAGTPDRIMSWLASRQNRQPPGPQGPSGPAGAQANPPPPVPNPVAPPTPPNYDALRQSARTDRNLRIAPDAPPSQVTLPNGTTATELWVSDRGRDAIALGPDGVYRFVGGVHGGRGGQNAGNPRGRPGWRRISSIEADPNANIG